MVAVHDTSQLTNKISDSVQIKHEMHRTLCSCVVRPHGLLLPVVDHIGAQGPHRTGIVTSKMNRCSRSVTLLHFFLTDNTEVRCPGTVRRLCTIADYSQVESPVLQLLEASFEIPRETPEDAASGGQRVPQSHNPAYLGSLRLDTHTHKLGCVCDRR